MVRTVLALASLIGLLATAGLAQDDNGLPAGGTETFSLTLAGLERTYMAHVPASAPGKAAPLVIVLHGAGGSGENAIDQGRWSLAADRHGFIVLAPDGSLEFPQRRPSLLRNPRSWNAGDGTGRWASESGVDDVGFLKAMIDLWVSEGHADPGRIYVTGFSNGAAMAFRAGAELPDRIAAIAPVSNGLLVPLARLSPPVALLLIWGSEDRINPIAGGEVERRGKIASRPSAEASWTAWADLLRCTRIERSDPGPQVSLLARTGCAQGTEALFYRIAGLGHQWPGGKSYVRVVSGPGSDAIDATEVIWAFFQRHARSR